MGSIVPNLTETLQLVRVRATKVADTLDSVGRELSRIGDARRSVDRDVDRVRYILQGAGDHARADALVDGMVNADHARNILAAVPVDWIAPGAPSRAAQAAHDAKQAAQLLQATSLETDMLLGISALRPALADASSALLGFDGKLHAMAEAVGHPAYAQHNFATDFDELSAFWLRATNAPGLGESPSQGVREPLRKVVEAIRDLTWQPPRTRTGPEPPPRR